MTVTYDQECVDRLIAEAIEKERKEFAIHAVDIARRAIRLEREACAKLADVWIRAYDHPSEAIARSIRERNNHD